MLSMVPAVCLDRSLQWDKARSLVRASGGKLRDGRMFVKDPHEPLRLMLLDERSGERKCVLSFGLSSLPSPTQSPSGTKKYVELGVGVGDFSTKIYQDQRGYLFFSH